MHKRIILSCIMLIFCRAADAHEVNNTDLVIFSFDRPLQLYALLESIETYVTGLHAVHVVYRTSNEHFAQGYEMLKTRFAHINYLQQGSHPRSDFKQLTLQATFGTPSEYIAFAVDDIIVKDFVDMNECARLLEKYNAYGFYLRMGLHLSECYSMSQLQRVPPCTQLEPDVFGWRFAAGECDWGYPNTVDMTVYRKRDIQHHIRSMQYVAPNTLEGAWAGNAHDAMARGMGLCYTESKIVNLPLNLVQQEGSNRHMNFMSSAQMLGLFRAGKKIDIKPLFKIRNKAAHMDYVPTFIDRES